MRRRAHDGADLMHLPVVGEGDASPRFRDTIALAAAESPHGITLNPVDDRDAEKRIESGRRLFNSGRFFEAHDVWEELWRLARGEERRRLQGLIQIAAACHKGLRQGNPGGCLRLLDAGLAKIDTHSTGEGLDALDIPAFRRGVRRFAQAVERWKTGEAEAPEASAAPRLERVSEM